MVWFVVATLAVKELRGFPVWRREPSWDACGASMVVNSCLLLACSSLANCHSSIFFFFNFNLLSHWLRPLGRSRFVWSWPERFSVVPVGSCLHHCFLWWSISKLWVGSLSWVERGPALTGEAPEGIGYTELSVNSPLSPPLHNHRESLWDSCSGLSGFPF